MSCRRPALVLASLLLIVMSSCEEGDGGAPAIRDLRTEMTAGPYVSVAVDNHFHDIHPEDDVTIAATRALVFKNEGGNLHNVTVVGTDVSHDLPVGEEFALDPVGRTLEPGNYEVVCRFHADEGMTGEFSIAAG